METGVVKVQGLLQAVLEPSDAIERQAGAVRILIGVKQDICSVVFVVALWERQYDIIRGNGCLRARKKLTPARNGRVPIGGYLDERKSLG